MRSTAACCCSRRSASRRSAAPRSGRCSTGCGKAASIRAGPFMLVGKPCPPSRCRASTGIGILQRRSERAAGAGADQLLRLLVRALHDRGAAVERLQRRGVPIWGIAYKDKPDAASDFLKRTGDPYARIARDEPGRVAIDFGVYGVPETYLVDRQRHRALALGRAAHARTSLATSSLNRSLRKYRVKRLFLRAVAVAAAAPAPRPRVSNPGEMLATPRRSSAPRRSAISCAASCARTRASRNRRPIWRATCADHPPAGRRGRQQPAGDRLDGGALRRFRAAAPAVQRADVRCSGPRR